MTATGVGRETWNRVPGGIVPSCFNLANKRPESVAAASNGNGHASSSASESEVIIDSGEFEVYEEVDPDDDSFIEVDEVMTLGEEEVDVEEPEVVPAANNSDDTIEIPFIESKEYEYLYREGDNFVVMDTETFDQLPIPTSVVGDLKVYLKPNETGANRSDWADLFQEDDSVKPDAEWRFIELPDRIDVAGDELLDLVEDAYFEVVGI